MHRPSVLSRFASRSLWLLRARLGWGGQKKVLMRGGRADSGTGTPMRLAQTGLTAWGTILRANPGVPPFLLSRLFGLERSWNKSCELLPVGPASWSCNLILGTPDVSIYSSGERTRERVGARGVLPERSWGPASCSGVGCPGRDAAGGMSRRHDTGAVDHEASTLPPLPLSSSCVWVL